MKQSTEVLAAAIIKFLENEASALPADKKEGLQGSARPDAKYAVAASCIRHSLGVTNDTLRLPTIPSLYELGAPPKASEDARAHAESYKNAGNAHLAAKRARDAADDYTRAIELDPQNAVYYCNRAAAWTLLEDYASAIEDCMAATSLNPRYAKAYSRLGAAYVGANNAEQAAEAYAKALELEPDNAAYKAALEQARAKLRRTQPSPNPSSSGSGRMPPMGAGGLDLASLMNNPELMNMASQMMSDPEAMRNMMSNPNLQAMMQGMMGGGRSPRQAQEEAEEE